MNQLTNKTCVACRVGAPLATEDEINDFMQQLPNWSIVDEDDVKRLKRVFAFNKAMSPLSVENITQTFESLFCLALSSISSHS